MKFREAFANLVLLSKSISSRRRSQFAFLFFLMMLTAVAEVVSLSAVVPFLGILSDPSSATTQPSVASCVELLGLSKDSATLRRELTILFCVAAVVAGLMRFALIYVAARVNYGTVHELGAEVFRRTLYQTYDVHVKRNSSEIIGAIGKVDVVAWGISFFVKSLSAALMALSIVATLILIDPVVSICVLGGVGAVYVLVSIVTRKQLDKNSQVINESYGGRVQAVQEGLGSVRDMILDHSQTIFAARFNQIDKLMRQSQASNAIIGPSPRFGVEALGMILIATLAYQLTLRDGDLMTSLPMLGALALGAQRLMPLVQQMYRGVVYLVGNREVMADVGVLLAQPVAKELESEAEVVPFVTEIRLDNIRFRYADESPEVLAGVSLVIPKGACVGFVGETGSGKSTLLDIVMGLLSPTDGDFTVDGDEISGARRHGWQKNIAHVPQTIFLLDASFAENIAIGTAKDKIDLGRVKLAAEKAQISSFIEQSSEGYFGMVGERGVRLSGGQRQRIGLARAIYKKAPVLILDEATSALDQNTESAVMEAVLGLGKDLTVLMIAHRLSTLDECDFIVALENGTIKSIVKRSNSESRSQ